jgi:ferredoxin
MKVWIDQDLCTGDGLCAEIAPEVFGMADDGLAYVRQDGKMLGGGALALASVAAHLREAVAEACEECPGECIFLVEEPGDSE